MVSPTIHDRYFVYGLIDRGIFTFSEIFSPNTWINYKHIFDAWELVNLKLVREAWESVELDLKRK